ncbi:MAG TPA: sensor histidine kinase [Verrucomicrobiae bacterium]
MMSRLAICRTFAMACVVLLAFCHLSPALFADNKLPLLTQAQQIRQLTPEEAAKNYPVKVQAVVTFYRQDICRELTIQDGTGGIYVTNTSPKGYRLKAGDLVELTGISGPGSYAPVIILSNLTVLGHEGLPPAREMPIERLFTGAEDCQWLQVRGTVRSTTKLRTDGAFMLQFDLATSGGVISVRVPNYDATFAERLVDSEIMVKGACMTFFNNRRQMTGIRLAVPDFDQITILKPAPADAFAVSARTINSLHQFAPEAAFGHRVKVHGTVLHQESGQSLFIRDETQGLWVKTKQAMPLNIGDQVEVLGFPATGGYSPTLEDAIYKKTSSGVAPAPIPLTPDIARNGAHDADLVQLEGQLLEWIQTPTEHVLIVQNQDWTYRAHLAKTNNATFTPPPQFSQIQLTGICQIQVGGQRWPQAFHLLLRNPADVLLLRSAPWWNRTRVMVALGTTSVLCFAGLIWIITLKRQVRLQTAVIQQKVEREAVLEERTRIAREFHDTIEQQLGAILLQLQAARSRLETSPEFSKRALNLIESMLRHTQSETRHSVWDLRARALEDGHLGTALSATASYVRNGSSVNVDVSVTGEPRPLPGLVESHLLRISQEATANAVKHARAHSIKIELAYRNDDVRLIVADDGQGFQPESAPSGQSGHFGLLGMRERAEKIGGQLHISSAPGRGARIEITVTA